MLSDDGNLLNPTTNNADPYFDSNTIQKNVTGLVGKKIDFGVNLTLFVPNESLSML
jgi:hypothetical protein